LGHERGTRILAFTRCASSGRRAEGSLLREPTPTISASIDTERCPCDRIEGVLTFEEALETWDGESVVVHRDRESGGWIFVCLHSTRLGPAGGGTRMKVYGTPAEALEDAMRLSAAMTPGSWRSRVFRSAAARR